MNYAPSPWGREFHGLSMREALGGGSAGPGKSLALLMDPMGQVAIEHERCAHSEIRWGESIGWAIHLRREFPRLEQTMRRAELLFPKLDPGVKWEGGSHTWRFSSGYKYQFGHLRDNDTFLNYRSNEYTWLGIDEIGEIEHKETWDQLCLRVRTTDPVLRQHRKARAVTNPTANWVREYFVDPAPQGRVLLVNEITLGDGTKEDKTRLFLPARLSDNPNAEFRRDYEADLRDKPPHIRAALLDGNWYVVAGAFFADLWDPDRVVIKPIKFGHGWRKFRSGDWGYKSPGVVHWWCITPENELICYREFNFNGPKAKQLLDATAVAERIKDIEKAAGEWNNLTNRSRLTGPMDSQLWSEIGHRGPTMADDMAKVGVSWFKATKGRRQAAHQLIKRLKTRGYNGRPGIMFFETCHKAISTIPALGTDPSDPEVPADGGPDHWFDSVAYACAANLVPSGKEDFQPDPEERWETDKYEKAPDRGQYGYGGW